MWPHAADLTPVVLRDPTTTRRPDFGLDMPKDLAPQPARVTD
jgi:hypothetical protein